MACLPCLDKHAKQTPLEFQGSTSPRCSILFLPDLPFSRLYWFRCQCLSCLSARLVKWMWLNIQALCLTFARPGRRKEGYEPTRHFIGSPIVHLVYPPIFCQKNWLIVFNSFWDSCINHIREIPFFWRVGGGGGGENRGNQGVLWEMCK